MATVAKAHTNSKNEPIYDEYRQSLLFFFFSSNFLEKILIRMLSIFNGFDEAVFQGVLISSKYFEFFHKKSTLQTIRDVIVNLHFTGKCMNWFLWLFVEEPWKTKRLKSISKQIRGIYIQTRIIYFC